MMVFVLVPVFNESCGTVLSNFTGWLGSEDTDGDGHMKTMWIVGGLLQLTCTMLLNSI